VRAPRPRPGFRRLETRQGYSDRLLAASPLRDLRQARALPSWHRALGLNPALTPEFVTTPGQVAFTPDGSKLIVTTKANGNDIDVFAGSADPRPPVPNYPAEETRHHD